MSDSLRSTLLIGGGIGLLSGLIAAVVQGFGSSFACLAVLLIGVVVVWYHTNQTGDAVSGGDGAAMGAGAAAVMVVVESIVQGLLMGLGLVPTYADKQQEALRQLDQLPAEQAEIARSIIEWDWLIPATLGCTLLVYVVVGAISGAIGAAIFKSDDADASPADEPRPPTSDDAPTA